MLTMGRYILDFQEIGREALDRVGGKGANLGELAGVEDICVPDGFCVTTEAFQEAAGAAEVGKLLERLSILKVADKNEIAELGREIRRAIEHAVIPAEVREEIISSLSRHGEGNAYAIRSSATAEDLPNASFAGQQDTYLNIIGKDEVLKHISKCWASLFTDRAIVYRIQNDFDHRKVSLAVVVQRMVFPEVSGIMFTADPVSGNRKVTSIDASFGLGEALVSGLVNADVYKIKGDKLVEKKIAAKKLAIYALEDGGTESQEIGPEQQSSQALTDEQILELGRLGRKIEAHFGCPQDIEWCLANNRFYIVQSRPITTLFPIPKANDAENHVYVSVGHQQMMTDAMKPLGLSLWERTAGRPMSMAAGRLFVDITEDIASPEGRAVILGVLGKSDPLVRDALTTILERGDFIKLHDDEPVAATNGQSPPRQDYRALNDYDPAIVGELIRRGEASVHALAQNIGTKSGTELIDFIMDDLQERKKSQAETQSFAVIMTSMNAASWINEHIERWLGEKNVADTLSLSVPHNITSEMGLALLDVGDVVRSYPEVIDFLQNTNDNAFPEQMAGLQGGAEARDAIEGFLHKYGMRCPGEIDVTKPRWSERPTMLIPLILGNIKNLEPGASKRKFEHGLREALRKEEELAERLRLLPEGEEKVRELKRMTGLMRSLAGYREYPKYGIVSRYFIYKQALLREAERLVQVNVIHEKEDIYYLNFDELRHLFASQIIDYGVIEERKADYEAFKKLTPPRMITSDGEILNGSFNKDHLPDGAIAGLAVSSGVVEGRARVVLRMEDADLEEGDILVTAFTDPSWTPLFVSIKGLITEVGGLMTHGAVIAREYGLPAVVGVDNATRLIADGQKIRVHGTEGYIEIL